MQVETTSKLITSLLAKPDNSKDLTESLQICKEQYGNILDSIEESKNQVAQRNVIEARFKFSAAISLQVSCNDSFTAGTSPIVKEAQDVFDLAGNCLDIMKAIEDRESRRRRGGSPVTSPSVPSPCQGQVGLCSQLGPIIYSRPVILFIKTELFFSFSNICCIRRLGAQVWVWRCNVICE